MTDAIVWIDCEMTGLDLVADKLIEIAVVITDSDLEVLDEGLDLVIGCDEPTLAQMVPYVQQMHERSGLTEQVRASSMTVAEAEQQVLAYIRRFVPEQRNAPLAGNSIATDRSFLARDMKALDDHLHYRMVDVSSIKELTRRWFPPAYSALPEKQGGHRALADIMESIEELRYYRRTVFVEPDAARLPRG